MGKWGIAEFVEPHVRRLIAEHLGVGVEELVSHVSLREDLAADSLDLVELAVALEGEFGIVVPDRILDEVRTYSDLVRATGLLILARRAAEARGAEPPAEDVLRAGGGARLEVTVAASTAASVARVQHQFARLRKRGVQVTIRPDDRLPALPVHSTVERVA